MAFGLLLIRVVIGLALAAHGAQKLFGMFGGHGISGTAGFFESIGFRPGKPLAVMAGLGETGGGVALALGLLTPFAAAVVIATMIVAIWGVHYDKGFFAQGGGYEYPLIVAAIAAGLAFTGAGPISLDAALGLAFEGAKWGLIAIGLGIVGAVPPLTAQAVAVRRRTAS